MYTYVYIKSEPGLYTVGFWKHPKHPNDRPVWMAESDWDTVQAAAARVNYLNGGPGHVMRNYVVTEDNDDEQLVDCGVTNLQDRINELLYKAGITEDYRSEIMQLIARGEQHREDLESARILFQRQSETS